MVKAFQSAALAPAGKSAPPRQCHARAQAAQPQHQQRQPLDRRALLFSAAVVSVAISQGAQARESGAQSDYSLFKPDKNKTPALRAGTVDKENPYSFLVPKNWSEKRVANIQSGNYCQPRCAEPWTEVIFGEDTEGKASVIVAPLVRLTNKKDAKIEDIGKPADVLSSVGPFITGSYLDAEDVQSIRTVTQDDGLTYYYYDAYATYGLNGPHTLTAATVKGDLVLMFSASANDKQYNKAKTKLDTMVQSFRA